MDTEQLKMLLETFAQMGEALPYDAERVLRENLWDLYGDSA